MKWFLCVHFQSPTLKGIWYTTRRARTSSSPCATRTTSTAGSGTTTPCGLTAIPLWSTYTKTSEALLRVSCSFTFSHRLSTTMCTDSEIRVPETAFCPSKEWGYFLFTWHGSGSSSRRGTVSDGNLALNDGVSLYRCPLSDPSRNKILATLLTSTVLMPIKRPL